MNAEVYSLIYAIKQPHSKINFRFLSSLNLSFLFKLFKKATGT